MNKHCSYCGLETWACGCGGHCYSEKEHQEWKEKFEKADFNISKILNPENKHERIANEVSNMIKEIKQ